MKRYSLFATAEPCNDLLEDHTLETKNQASEEDNATKEWDQVRHFLKIWTDPKAKIAAKIRSMPQCRRARLTGVDRKY